MKILFTNDDGYDTVGIQMLYKEFAPYYDTYMCAPLKHKSAFSHAINYMDHLELQTLTGDVRGYALDGTPADCARVALEGLFKEKFDLVLSGINYGINAAQDIFYSGTVGAAREATFHGVMAIATSLDVKDDGSQTVNDEIVATFQYAAMMARRIVEALPKEAFDYKESVININFPECVPAKGIKLTKIGHHDYVTELCHSTQDDKDYVKINTINKSVKTKEGTDVYHLDQGYIVITALYQGIVYNEALQSILAPLEQLSVDPSQ